MNKIKTFLAVGLCWAGSAGSAATFEKSIRDLYFEIHSDELKELIERKASLKKFEKFYCSVYWIKGQKEVVVRADHLKDEIKKVLEEACQRKSFLVLPSAMEEYLSLFQKSEQKGEWSVYKDATGINPINEIWTKEAKLEQTVVEKRPTGSTKTVYTFVKRKNDRILTEVTRTSYEGVQNIKTRTKVHYHLVDGAFYLPKMAETSTTQNLVKKEMGQYTRKIEETYHFKNYKVNASKALIYFSKR